MRTNSGNNICFFIFPTVFILAVSFARAEDVCDALSKNWAKVQTYRCTYRAITSHEGKIKETVMVYTYEKPGKVRMDIRKPQKGAVLVYNPEKSEKVKVRPFPRLKFMVLDYNLTDKRVSSDSGGTVDRSDLGTRTSGACADMNNKNRRYSFDENGLIRKSETLDSKGKVVEIFEWTDLKTNLDLPADTFTDFSPSPKKPSLH